MKLTKTLRSWRPDIFTVVEKLLTAAALVLMAVTVGGQLGQMLGLHGAGASAVGWSIAIVYDALWIGALRMSEVAIRQRSKIGMAVMLGTSAVAISVSVATLLILGHAKVFAFVPVAAAVFMGLRLFADNVLADGDTAIRIAEQSAADRNARALAEADARHLASEARTDVVTETAEHRAEVSRQIARAGVLTEAQKRLSKARAEAEAVLQTVDADHGQQASEFMARELVLLGSRPAITTGGRTPAQLGGHTVVTQVMPEIAPVTTQGVTAPEAGLGEDDEPVPADGALTLQELAAAAAVSLPQPGVTLSDEQLAVVLRWLRYAMEPPRSYRQAQKAFREAGYVAREERVRGVWGEIETLEVEVAVP